MHALWPLAIWPGPLLLVLIVGIVFGRRRYKWPYAATQPGPEWVRTQERFRDPVTRKHVQVWYNPASGERRYVEAARGADQPWR